MPRKSGYEVRGEFLALQLFDKVGKSVSPNDINNHVGRGDYAAKYISFLKNRHGFSFSVQKDNRSVVSYTLEAEPKNAAEVRAKATSVKPTKAKKAKPVSKAEDRRTKAAAVKSVPVESDEVTKAFGSSGSVPSYSVDPDWDAVGDVRELL